MVIAANTVRYIKLGRGGCWVDVSLDRGEIHFGYGRATHELALAGDVTGIKRRLVVHGRKTQAATRDACEVMDFYQLGSDCLWITLARGHLWWTFAGAEVTWLGGDGQSAGERYRTCIGGWCCTDTHGVPLQVDTLEYKITKLASYQRTICRVSAEKEVIRRINGSPLVVAELSITRAGSASPVYP